MPEHGRGSGHSSSATRSAPYQYEGDSQTARLQDTQQGRPLGHITMEKKEDDTVYPTSWHQPSESTLTPPMMIVSIVYAAYAGRRDTTQSGVGHPTNGVLKTNAG
jgi:hypothetical protein